MDQITIKINQDINNKKGKLKAIKNYDIRAIDQQAKGRWPGFKLQRYAQFPAKEHCH